MTISNDLYESVYLQARWPVQAGRAEVRIPPTLRSTVHYRGSISSSYCWGLDTGTQTHINTPCLHLCCSHTCMYFFLRKICELWISLTYARLCDWRNHHGLWILGDVTWMAGGCQAWTHTINQLLIGLEGGLGVQVKRVVRRREVVLGEK